MRNTVEFKVWGRYALFTDPVTKIGGEKCTYQIPTYQALKGILESIYWKPTITWVIDKVRVMKAIKTQSQGVKPVNYTKGGNALSIYTYLADVEYQVRSHFIWNEQRPDLAADRNENKHYFVAKRMIERGGRRDVFLGTRECQAYVEPVKFGSGEGAYDNLGELSFGLMVHGFDYPSETGVDELSVRFWYPKMVNGVVDFIKPEECTIRKKVKKLKTEPLETSGLLEKGLLDGYVEGTDLL
jgi:CRISPR-associated protein Cas5d